MTYGIYQYDGSAFVEYTGTDVYWDANDLDFHYTTTTKGMQVYYIKALTHGGKAVDYEKIRITICGLETLTPSSSDPIALAYTQESTYTGLSIPWSTISTWFVFDDNTPQSDPTCRSQAIGNVDGGIRLYTDSSLTNSKYYNPTTYVELALEAGSSDQYEIKVYNDGTWPATLTFWYGEYTLGGVSAAQEIQITVCGGETLIASAEETFFFLATDTYDGEAIEWDVYQTYFTMTAGTPECRQQTLPNQKIYTDAALTTLADSTNVELVEDVAGEFRLKIYKNAPWTSIMTFYI